MATEWVEKKILITVRTYPVPATKGVEVSCTAGVTDTGDWIRLFPIPYRLLENDRQFKKYQWVSVKVTKAQNDQRPESFKPRIDQIKLGNLLPTDRDWRARWEVLRPFCKNSMCEIQFKRNEKGAPTLGMFKPKISRLRIEQCASEWTERQLNALNQTSLFDETPAAPLEKIPFEFSYEFSCSTPECTGHKMSCTDWEMGQSFRSWRKKYGDGWERAFRKKYEDEMINKNDTHFFVGNLHQFPNSWIIIGLFYPPPQKMEDFFL